jgi:hypothetical protein
MAGCRDSRHRRSGHRALHASELEHLLQRFASNGLHAACAFLVLFDFTSTASADINETLPPQHVDPSIITAAPASFAPTHAPNEARIFLDPDQLTGQREAARAAHRASMPKQGFYFAGTAGS